MPYPLPWYRDQDAFPDDPDMWRGFTAQDYTLAFALDVEDNHAAEQVVRDAVRARNGTLVHRIRFDSEAGCFFAHTDDEQDMKALIGIVAELVDRHHPDAIPGTIADSPASIRIGRNPHWL